MQHYRMQAISTWILVERVPKVMVQEEYGMPHKIRVLVSRDLGPDKLVVGFKDLKNINILNMEFPKTLPEWRRDDAKQVNAQYNSIRGDQWNEQMEVKEQRERTRGVLLYLEERYEAVNEKITSSPGHP